MSTNIIEFLRKKDYAFLKELGQGACGKTVLMNDDIINQQFVCKKYSPITDERKAELFKRFIEEIKILHLLYHQNVVRVFNYYIYPDVFAGFILMEYINGEDIEQYLRKHPENINEIFFQTINGFKYLEENNILHRDIRPQNMLVRNDGILKIIDFGFGKIKLFPLDNDKSISLNWWCELPNDFNDKVYDIKTEVYFVGKLFEKIIIENNIEYFQYNQILNLMCEKNPLKRIDSFEAIDREILSDRFIEIEFNDDEMYNYRNFSTTLYKIISKIENGAKYYNDIDKVQKNIEDLYKTVMLEELIPDSSRLLRCFISGTYYFKRNISFEISALKSFIHLLRASSQEKKNIILSNLYSKLDSIERYYDEPNDTPFNDDIPF